MGHPGKKSPSAFKAALGKEALMSLCPLFLSWAPSHVTTSAKLLSFCTMSNILFTGKFQSLHDLAPSCFLLFM